MATLEELRVELDKIDNQMVELYQKRMNVCREVGDYKVKAGRKVYDRQREQEKLADVASKVDNDFDKNGVRELYTQLMSMSRKLQYQKLVEAGALGRLPFIQIDSLESCVPGNRRCLRRSGNASVLWRRCELLSCKNIP